MRELMRVCAREKMKGAWLPLQRMAVYQQKDTQYSALRSPVPVDSHPTLDRKFGSCFVFVAVIFGRQSRSCRNTDE